MILVVLPDAEATRMERFLADTLPECWRRELRQGGILIPNNQRTPKIWTGRSRD